LTFNSRPPVLHSLLERADFLSRFTLKPKSLPNEERKEVKLKTRCVNKKMGKNLHHKTIQKRVGYLQIPRWGMREKMKNKYKQKILKCWIRIKFQVLRNVESLNYWLLVDCVPHFPSHSPLSPPPHRTESSNFHYIQ
jgi:hypothetical protein